MSHDQDKVNAYNARRRLEAENAMLRAKRDNDRLKGEAQSLAILDGLAALFTGKSWLFVSHCKDGWRIDFQKQQD